MRIIQFENSDEGRRVGVVVGDQVRDVTSIRSEWKRTIDVFAEAEESGKRFVELLESCAESPEIRSIDYKQLIEAGSIRSPVDAADPRGVFITGTGLTHLGSMKSRDEMHATETNAADDEPVTDSKKMFQMGLEGGKPDSGQRGVAPEWFYKGNGTNLRACGQTLEIPSFAPDGGEEAELVGCYVIDQDGTPRRLGFALGNEWSDHATERVNYLYLAPSKLRQCAVGPELITDCEFEEIKLRCTVTRAGEVIYDSGELLSGQQHMSHSLANCEDHHFKYPQHCVPGDVHLHYFGTSKLSFGQRDWQYQDGDEICVQAIDFGASLINRVRRVEPSQTPVKVKPA